MFFKPVKKEDSPMKKRPAFSEYLIEDVDPSVTKEMGEDLKVWQTKVSEEINETKIEMQKDLDHLKSDIMDIFTDLTKADQTIPVKIPIPPVPPLPPIDPVTGRPIPPFPVPGPIDWPIPSKIPPLPPMPIPPLPVPPQTTPRTEDPRDGGGIEIPLPTGDETNGKAPSDNNSDGTPSDGGDQNPSSGDNQPTDGQTPKSPTEEVPTPPEPPAPSDNTGSGGSSSNGTQKSSEALKQIEEMLQNAIESLNQMNSAVIKRVEELEEAIKERSEEIKTESKNAFNEAIERTRKIKQAMYEAELKDLELQKIAFSILDEAEDKVIEREKKMQDLFFKKA